MDCSTQSSSSFTHSWSLLRLTSIKMVMPSNHLVLCCPLLLQSLPASGDFPVSQFLTSSCHSIGATASASVLPMSIQGCFLLAVQGTLKNLLQHHSSKTSVLLLSAFFNGPTLTSIHDYWKNRSFQ